MAKQTVQERLDAAERRNAEMQAQLQTMMAVLAAQGAQTRTVAVGAQFQQVGIRNISSYTIGLTSPVKGEPEVQLAAHDWRQPHPANGATISFPFWQALRRGPFIEKGMIVRDDSILGDTSLRAPDDQESDLAPGWASNAVADPDSWITSRTEEELRAAVAAITSEASVRRLLAAVDQKIFEIGEEHYKGAEDRGKRAVRDLPAKYRLVEDLARERLDELMPSSQGRGDEQQTVARF